MAVNVTQEWLDEQAELAKAYVVKSNSDIKKEVEAKYADSEEAPNKIDEYVHLDYINALQSKFQRVNPTRDDVEEVVKLIDEAVANNWLNSNNDDGFVGTFVWVSERPNRLTGEPVLETATLYKSLGSPGLYYYDAQYQGNHGYGGTPNLEMRPYGTNVPNTTAAWMRITRVAARPNRYAGLEGMRHCDVGEE